MWTLMNGDEEYDDIYFCREINFLILIPAQTPVQAKRRFSGTNEYFFQDVPIRHSPSPGFVASPFGCPFGREFHISPRLSSTLLGSLTRCG